MNFEQWMKAVDTRINAICGLSSGDLADQMYADWFEDGWTPDEAAREALDEEGFFDND